MKNIICLRLEGFFNFLYSLVVMASGKLKMVTWDVDYTIDGHKIVKGYDWEKDPDKFKIRMKVKDMGIVISRPFNRCFHCARRYVDSDNKSITYCAECDIMLHVGGEEFLQNYNQEVINTRIPVPNHGISYNWDTLEPFEVTDDDVRRVDRYDVRKAIDAKFSTMVMESTDEENLPRQSDVSITWDDYIMFNLKKARIRHGLRVDGGFDENFKRADTL